MPDHKAAACSLTIAAVLASAGAAQAALVKPVTNPGAGYSVIAALPGVEGVAKNDKKWFDHDNGARSTNWSNERITFTFDLADTPSDYRLGVTAINSTDLIIPPNFKEFRVDVIVNGSLIDTLDITASDTDWSTSWLDLGARSGETSITLNWRNDSYKKGSYDANIAIGSVALAAPGVAPIASAVIPTPGPVALGGIALAVTGFRTRRSQ